MLKKGVFYIGAVLMVGCTTLPDHSVPKEKTPPVAEKKSTETPSGVKIMIIQIFNVKVYR